MSSEVVLTVLIAPVALLIAKFVLDEVIKPRLGSTAPAAPAASAPVIGQPVAMPDPISLGWQAALDGLKGSLAREETEHRACHALMREHGVEIPHD